MKKSSKNVGHQVRKQVRVQQQRLMLCAKADDSPSVKRMGNFSQMLTGLTGGSSLERKKRKAGYWLLAESGGGGEVSCSVRVGCI